MVEYTRLGAAAVEVSEFALGAWMFGARSRKDDSEIVPRDRAFEILDAAWSAGVNFIDTANVYGKGRSEEYIGAWLADKNRDDFVLASKVFVALSGRQEIGLSRKIILREIEGTLERLGTDHLDVYYIHAWHPGSPLEETLAALNHLVDQGKVHYLGVSNFATWQLVLAQKICEARGYAPISVVQPRFSAVDSVPFTADPHEMALPDLLDACHHLGIAVCSYSPLAEGFLTGKYRRDADGRTRVPPGSRADHRQEDKQYPERWWSVLSAVEQVAAELGATPAQVALRWVRDAPGVTSVPILGATSASQLVDSLRASELHALRAAARAHHRRRTDPGDVRLRSAVTRRHAISVWRASTRSRPSARPSGRSRSAASHHHGHGRLRDDSRWPRGGGVASRTISFSCLSESIR